MRHAFHYVLGFLFSFSCFSIILASLFFSLSLSLCFFFFSFFFSFFFLIFFIFFHASLIAHSKEIRTAVLGKGEQSSSHGATVFTMVLL